jgi:hypothetical protein
MNPDIGTGQTSITVATSASISALSYYFTRFVSGPLKGAQTISANTWNYAYAAAENNANANFPNAGTSAAKAAVPINVYVWRPSTGAKVGTVLDGNTAASYYEPTATNTEMAEYGQFTGSSVSAADGDVIICEIWFTTTQGNATSRNDTFYFDGTTENTTIGTTVSNYAAFIETPQTLAFYAIKYLTETITFSDGVVAGIVPAAGTNVNVSAKKGTISLDTTSGTHDQSFTGIGFQPKALIIWGIGVTAGTETYQEGLVYSFGMSDGTTSGAVGNGVVDAATTCAHVVRNDAIIELLSPSTPSTLVVRAFVKTFDSDGFTLTYNTKTDTTAYTFHYLALGGSDLTNIKLKHETAGTTATGNASYTGCGFKPDVMLFAGSMQDAVNTNATTGATLCLGAATSSSRQFSLILGKDSSTGNMHQFNDNRVLFGQVSPFQNVKMNASLVSFDTDGYTLNHTVAPGATTWPWFYLAIKGGLWDCGVASQRSGTGNQNIGIKYISNPIALLLAENNLATADSQQNTGTSMSIGAADSALNQGCAAMGNNPSGNNFPVKVHLTSALSRAFTPAATATSSTTNNEADINDMSTAGQFQLAWTTADSTARKMGYVVLIKGIAATGQNVTKSLTETTSITGSPARTAAKTRTQTETIALAGSITRLTTKTRLLTETVTLAGTPARTKGKVKTLSETITIGDSLARLTTKIRILTESIAITGTVARSKGKLKTLTETITLAGTPARLATKIRTLSENISVTGSLARSKGKLKTLTETITLAGTPTRLATKIRTVTETIAVTGTVARTKNSIKLLTESISITGTVAKLQTKVRSLSESITLAGTVARSKGKLMTLIETITLAGTVTRLAAKTRTLTESIAVTGSIGRLTTKVRSLAESISITGSATATNTHGALNITKSLSESIAITASVNRLLTKTRTLTEAITIGESLTRSKGKVKSLTETITLAGTVTRTAAKLRTLTETVTLVDSLGRLTTKSRGISQTITFADSVARQVNAGAKQITRFLSESITISDFLTRNTAKIRTFTENITLSGTPTRSTGKTRTLPAETITISDAVTRTITQFHAKVMSLTETITIGDSLTRLANKKRTLTESISVTGSLVKQKGKNRTLSEAITLAGTVTRQAAKVRRLTEVISIYDVLLQAFKNGKELLPPPHAVGGYTTPYERVKQLRSKLKTILYPVYTPAEMQRIERQRKLRQYEPIAIIPAFEQSINRVVAPFVVTDVIQNRVYVRFAVAASVTNTTVTFKGSVPIVTATLKPHTAKSYFIASQKATPALQKQARKMQKLAKLMAAWTAMQHFLKQ